MADFIGRAAELAVIRGLVAGLPDAAGAPEALVFSGEPGVGKSRLLAEALRHRPRAIRSIRMAGYEPEQNVPLASAQPVLSALLPNGLPRPTDQLALFEAAHDALSASTAPVLVIVDDLQWADDPSLALLHYLLRGAATSNAALGLVAASRPSARTTGFVDAIDRLPGIGFDAREIAPLTAGEAHELARRLGAGVAADELARRAAGSPFWMEVLAGGRSGNRAGTERSGRQVVLDRLVRLDADALELLSLLVIAGRPIEWLEAEQVLRWPEARARYAVDALVAAGVGRVGVEGISLAHDLIREAVGPGIPDIVRTRLQRALGRHLERIAEADIGLLWEALEHRRAARDPLIEIAARLATGPNRRLLGLERVADLARIAAEDETGQALELHRAVAALAGELGAHQAAIATWQQVLALERSPVGRLEAAVGACRAALDLGDRDLARRLLSGARADLDVEPSPAHGVTLDALEAGIVRWLEGDPAAAREHAIRALEAARALARGRLPSDLEADERRTYLDALQAASDSAMAGMARAEMLQLAYEMRDVAAGAEPPVRVRASFQCSVAEHMNGRLRDAELSARWAWDEAGRLHLPALRADAGYFLGVVLLDQARPAEAREILGETAALLDRTGGHLSFNNQVALPRADAEILRGNWRTGIAILEAEVAGIDDPHVRMRVHGDLVAWRARLHGPDAAPAIRDALPKLAADAAAAGCRRCIQELEVVVADALAAAAEPTLATAALRRWEALRPVEVNLFERLHALRARARLDDTAAALGELRAALDDADVAGQLVEAIWSRIVLADILGPRDAAAAAAELRRVADASAASGLVIFEALARQRAHRLGIRTWRRGKVASAPAAGPAEPLAALSPREREVVERIAAGDSNKDIAAALFLSPRTVDRHVENILRKLGVPNRAAIVAASRLGSSADEPAGSSPIGSR